MPGYDNDTPDMKPDTPSENSLIQVHNVSKSFGLIDAVKNVSLHVTEGSIFGLIGSDGAGKSTLLRMIATMIRPSSGRILIDGLDVVSQRASIKHLTGYMPQHFGLYKDLTVGENLDFFMDIFGISGPERTKRRERYLSFSTLFPFTERLAGDLSGGMKQKLGLACVLVHEPRVLILDEPTNGVDPVSRQEFWDILQEMKREGMTILISTAYLDEGEKCDQLALMHQSHIFATAPPQQIQSHFSSLEEAIIDRIKEVDKELLHDTFRF
jgi:ABC-2 type transport system ATP-binding protein